MNRLVKSPVKIKTAFEKKHKGKEFSIYGTTGDESFKFLKDNGIIPNYIRSDRNFFSPKSLDQLASSLDHYCSFLLFLQTATNRWWQSHELWKKQGATTDRK